METKTEIVASFLLLSAVAAVIVVGTASATTYTVCATGCDYTTIMGAQNAASSYDKIFVYNGSYNENVAVRKPHLTLEGEGKDVVTVTPYFTGHDVFIVESNMDYVNISGFTVTGTTDDGSGIFLDHADHCNIFDNDVSNNYRGIYLWHSNNNELTGNTANQNTDRYGIQLQYSSSNTLTSNTANNNIHGIYMGQSSYNELTGNTANENTGCGVKLSSSSNNEVIGNTANENNYAGIYLQSSSNYNSLTGNTANENKYGIHLGNADNNDISCNWVQANVQRGFYLEYPAQGSTGNTIGHNNIITNGEVQADGSYHWNFYIWQANSVDAKNNYWGTSIKTMINASIYDYYDDPAMGKVNFSGYKSGPVPCAPIPEAATVVLFSMGLLALGGYCWVERRREKRERM